MTYQEAIFAVREVGTITADGERIKVQIPPSTVARLSPAIEVLRLEKAAVIAALGSPCPGVYLPYGEAIVASRKSLSCKL